LINLLLDDVVPQIKKKKGLNQPRRPFLDKVWLCIR